MKRLPTARQCVHQRARQCARQRGFTLIELMIAVAVVALLMSVALPSFFDSMRKSRRSEAFTTIAAAQQAQERWRAKSPTYSVDFKDLGLSSSTTSSITTAKGYYTVTVAAVNDLAIDYVITATAAGAQASDTRCAVMAVKITSGNVSYGSGASSVDYSDTNRCWAR